MFNVSRSRGVLRFNCRVTETKLTACSTQSTRARFDIAPRRKSKERLLGLFFAAFLRHECAELTCIGGHAEG
jgi:hypothetical protein